MTRYSGLNDLHIFIMNFHSLKCYGFILTFFFFKDSGFVNVLGDSIV